MSEAQQTRLVWMEQRESDRRRGWGIGWQTDQADHTCKDWILLSDMGRQMP